MESDNYSPTKTLGDGVTVNFSHSFKMANTSEGRIYLENTTTLVQTLQTLGSDYTHVLSSSGGIVTFITPPSSVQHAIIARDTPLDQGVDYKTSKGFDGEVVENSFDKNTKQNQEVKDKVDRSIKLSVGSTLDPTLPTPEADKVIGWDSAGTALENHVSADSAVTAAQAAQIAAEAAQTSAETAETAAELAETNAETAETNASASATAAANSAASVNLPTISAGDTKKKLRVNSGETAFELMDGETLEDKDGDTKIEVEQTSDEDKVRISTVGVQRALIDSNGLTLQSGTNVNELSIDGTLAGNSDNVLPTEKAVKTYVDSGVGLKFVSKTEVNTQANTSGAISLTDGKKYKILLNLIVEDTGSAVDFDTELFLNGAGSGITIFNDIGQEVADSAWGVAVFDLQQAWRDSSSATLTDRWIVTGTSSYIAGVTDTHQISGMQDVGAALTSITFTNTPSNMQGRWEIIVFEYAEA